MNLKNYIPIVLISILFGFFAGGLIGAIIAVVINMSYIIQNHYLGKIDRERDQEANQEEDNRKTHNLNLKATIQNWKDLLPIILPTEEINNGGRFDGFDISFIEKIETLPFFEDEDIFYHYQGIKSIWNNFKIASRKYNLDKQALFDSIKETSNQLLINQNINIELEIESGFYVSVFKMFIIKASGINDKYNYYFDIISEGISRDNCQVKYCPVLKMPHGMTQRDDHKCHHIATTATTSNDPNIIKKIHTEIIKECMVQYIEKGNELIALERKLRNGEDSTNKLNKELQMILLTPSSQMDCKYVKIKKEDKWQHIKKLLRLNVI